MSKYLVIVESPAKANTIRKFLGRGYKVEASMGHVRDLPKSQLGVDIENGFEPKYITIRGKGPVLSKLKKLAKESEKILLATDPDREGEAISWHLTHILNIDWQSPCRIEFNEITKDAIKKAVKNPRPINENLVNAQQARRVVDRLVGYKISPLLWKKVKKGLSAGRVQSVALRLICDREEEIVNFKPEEYWTLTAFLAREGKGESFEAQLHSYKDQKLSVKNKEEMDRILKEVARKPFAVSSVKRGTKSRSPYPPYITSSLQQDAYNKLGFSAKKTMLTAQQLYEGIEVKGEGSVGLITYIRTDSTRVSGVALNQARSYIENRWGKGYLPKAPRVFKSKKGAQDAHEAIRPTSVNRHPDDIKGSLTPDQYRLYSLIWKRFVASQMSNAEYNTLSVDIKCGDYTFKASGSTITFKGFLEVYGEEENKKGSDVPELREGELLDIIKLEEKQHFTQPPSRYSEASLIKTLEEEGIGRPSTYAPIISTIFQRGYVERDSRALKPTQLGKVVNEVMREYFQDIVDVEFTAEMEKKLDEIEEKGADWRKVVEEFYRPMEEMIRQAEAELEKITIEDKKSDVICELCGETMVIKHGRYGKFLACPKFPECKNTKPFLQKTGALCPVCGGDMVVRKTKRRRNFYGCSNYPQCNFMTWDKPVKEKCPVCGAHLGEKKTKEGKELVCLNRECSYTRKDNKG